MARDDFHGWMWSEAVAVLARAEHLHQQFFVPATHDIAWEPPVDVLELDDMVLIIVALPGIDADRVETAIEGNSLRVSGRREHPPELRTAVIHRLELPQGRFERFIPLPPGRYAAVKRSAIHGCLLVSLHKSA
jgi:HSP20 family molecular chaperone IbpA